MRKVIKIFTKVAINFFPTKKFFESTPDTARAVLKFYPNYKNFDKNSKIKDKIT